VLILSSIHRRKEQVLHIVFIEPEQPFALHVALVAVLQVPILHSTFSHYQSITVIEVPGQLGRCLLLDDTIQFCSYDLDAYTDQMARHPLQLLQAVRGCGPSTTAAAATGDGVHAPAGSGGTPIAADAVDVTTPAFPPAGSSPVPGYIGCRKSLLQPPVARPSDARNGSAPSKSEHCLGPKQSQARVLLVGGGDGWIAGHLVSCYSEYVASVTAVELDKMVSDVTEKYFRDVMHGGPPFKHPQITWEYTDAYAWAVQRAARCSSSNAGSDAAVANSSNSSSSSSAQPDKQAAASGRRVQAGSASNVAETPHVMRSRSSSSTGSSSSSSSQGLKSASDCTGFDVVIIDSTDFTVEDARKLHKAAFYAALHQLMKPQAALIQMVQIYMRRFDREFKAMEAALQRAGWAGVGRTSVYAPSYGGDAVLLHAVKR
jgi:spermidine synthase